MDAYAKLAGAQFKNMWAYWSGLHRVVGENKLELHNRGQEQLMELQRHFAVTIKASVSGAPEPVVEAVHATVTAISSGLSTLARATADAAKLAAVQIAAVEAKVASPAATVTRKSPRRSSGLPEA